MVVGRSLSVIPKKLVAYTQWFSPAKPQVRPRLALESVEHIQAGVDTEVVGHIQALAELLEDTERIEVVGHIQELADFQEDAERIEVVGHIQALADFLGDTDRIEVVGTIQSPVAIQYPVAIQSTVPFQSPVEHRLDLLAIFHHPVLVTHLDPAFLL